MRIFSLASRNVFRNWRRTLVTTLAMGFAGLIMILFASLTEGLMQSSEKNAVAMDLGDIQIHAKGYREDPDLYKLIKNPKDIVSRLQQKGLYATYRLYGFGLVAAGTASAGVQLRGIDLTTESTVTEINKHLLQGQWLDKNDPRGVVIGKKLAKTLGVKPGDELVFIGQAADGSMANDLFTVRGILKSVGEGIDRAGFYLIENEFRELMVLPEGAHEIAVMRPDRSSDLDTALAKVTEAAPGYEIKTWRQLKPVIARILDLVNSQIIIMVVITYVAVAMVILNAMLMSVFERIRELGIMKAVGVKPGQIMLLVYLETLVQTVVACVIAVVFGWTLSIYFQSHGIDLSSFASGGSWGGVAIDPIWKAYVTRNAILIPVIFLFIISSLAVLYPAFKAAVIQPVKAIHHR